MNQKQKIELIEEQVLEIDSLAYRNWSDLDKIKRKVEMIIRNFFGEKSKYIEDLTKIHFSPRIAPVEESYSQHVWAEGKKEMRNLLITMQDEIKLFDGDQTTNQPKDPLESPKKTQEIFIVHGHDEEMKQSVARALEKLKLKPVILHERANQNQTLIGKFVKYSADTAFAIVLLSSDDLGCVKPSNPEETVSLRPRARQNVVLELGYFLGKLGQENVLTFFRKEDDFELPSDYSGILYAQYDQSERWKFDLVRELSAAGFEVDANLLIKNS